MLDFQRCEQDAFAASIGRFDYVITRHYKRWCVWYRDDYTDFEEEIPVFFQTFRAAYLFCDDLNNAMTRKH